jgi:hypothetical protein
MQCLFCGKELALLKRLRGGGEFCSEAHRKEYQEQYEQLALARLLQAKPSGEPAAPLIPEPALEKAVEQAPIPAQPQQRQIHARTPVAMIESAEASHPAEEGSPAPLAGFVRDLLVPAITEFQQESTLEMHTVTAPSLPGAAASAASGDTGSLPSAPRVDFGPSLQALDHHTRNERGMELREFAGPTPLMEIHLRPAAGSEPAGAADVMEILMSPRPPQKATPWLETPRGFPAVAAELGQLARLDFPTVGFAYSDAPVPTGSASTPVAPQAAVLTPEPPPAAPAAPVAPAPRHSPSPAETPKATAMAPAPPAEPPPPALVTQALPVTLHGLAAPRGKWTHAFSSAIAAASDVQVPLSAALPLRPLIVFGPAPAPAPAPVPAAKAPAPAPPAAAPQEQPKPVPSKPAVAKTESQFKMPVVPTPKAVPVKRAEVPETKAPQMAAPAAPPAEPRPAEPRKESPAFRPLEAAAASSDAELPMLHLETKESAWSKLSVGLKIGIAAAVIAGLAGIGYVVTRGNGKTVDEAPAAAAPAAPTVASGVPISGGWIDDWANAAKSRRHISLLSGSAKLSDYRMEFQAQIESKAIGWIFRVLNPRNYYVAKLETITPGLEPTVALVHFAVVDGQDENRVVTPLPMKVRVDTNYKIRFDAIGNRFAAWVQGQKIAEWTDSRFGSGGVGFFAERDEKAAMQGAVNVVALVPKN